METSHHAWREKPNLHEWSSEKTDGVLEAVLSDILRDMHEPLSRERSQRSLVPCKTACDEAPCGEYAFGDRRPLSVQLLAEPSRLAWGSISVALLLRVSERVDGCQGCSSVA